jgi:transglutaminase/protease-like cytokinesis protein 3
LNRLISQKQSFLLSIIGLIFCTKVFAQDADYVLFPRFIKAETLAKKLTKNCNSEQEKVDKISGWICQNIKYDIKSYQKLSEKYEKSKEILRSRKALCGGYSRLFVEMCQAAGIDVYYVTGYSRGSSFHENEPQFFEDHAWNVVKIDGIYRLLDVTWMAGSVGYKKELIRKIYCSIVNKPFVRKKKKIYKIL